MKKQLIFISYAHKKDIKFAKAIRKILRKECYEVFLADKSIPTGSVSMEQMEYNLKNMNVFMPIITKEYNNSPACQQEVGYAWALSHKKGILFYPIAYKAQPDFFLKTKQWKSIKKRDTDINTIYKIVKAFVKTMNTHNLKN